MSADLSSFTLKDGHPYPGDAHYMTVGVAGDGVLAGDRVLVGWLSKYCSGGSPSYTLEDDEREALVSFLEMDEDTAALYLEDLFGVAGSQGSVDYTLQGFPEVGEVPYSCVWTARGTLEQDPETFLYDIVWRKAERLTSGRRDANRLEIAGVAGVGFSMVWQEDPEGLRPGQGLGPGEGWSGAIVNQKTDIWYSYIGWDNFDLVCADPDADTCEPIPYLDFEGDTMPKVGVPMAIPVRISDNNMCKSGVEEDAPGYLPYCYADFNDVAGPDFCATSVDWLNPGGTSLDICETEDGRVLWGRTGSSRPRINLQGYDVDGDGVNDSAWVIMAYEELKALGEGGDELEEPIDIGKNIWYQSFDMFAPELVAQGGQIKSAGTLPNRTIRRSIVRKEIFSHYSRMSF